MLKKPKLVTITRKIELKINVTDKEERSSHYDKLRRWQNICREGANQVASHLFFQLMKDKMVYISEAAKIHEANIELDEKEILKLVIDNKKEIYKAVTQQSKAMLTTSPQNSCYQVLSTIYKGHVPTAILTSLAQTIFKSFNEEKAEYLAGKRALRNYKTGMPIPIRAPDITNVRNSTLMEKIYDKDTGEVTGEKKREFKDIAFTLYGIPFRTNFGRDLSDNEHYLKSALSAFFLPQWVWSYEAELSENILHSKKRRWDATFDDNDFHIAMEVDEKGNERFYQVTVTNAPTNLSFKMMRDEKKDGADKDKKIISYKIVNNMFLLDSSISIEKKLMKNSKDGRKEATNLYLNAVIQFEADRLPGDKSKTAYCYLDPKVPIKVLIDEKEYLIGEAEGFKFQREAIQGSVRKLQRAIKEARGSHGRKRKLKSMERYRQAEANFSRGKMHLYSKLLVGLCIEQGIGTVVLRDMEEKKQEAKEDKEVLRNWGYFGLNTLISYKMAKHGIVFVDESKAEKATE